MMYRALLAWALVLVVWPQVAHAGGLRDVDRATSGGSRSSSSSGSSSSSSSRSSGSSSSGSSSSWSSSSRGSSRAYNEEQCHSDPSACGTDSFGAMFFAVTFGAPWGIPRIFFDHAALERYAPYPFADGPGLLRQRPQLPQSELGQDELPLDDLGPPARKVAIALDVETGYQLQEVVPASLAVRAMLPFRVELDARFTSLVDLKDRSDLASAGVAHLTYRFAQGQRYDFRTGLGLRMFQLDQLRLGFDLLYGVDVYIASRVVWKVELHAGSAGPSFVGQARSTLGVMFARFELYAGYDHTAYIGASSRASLGGPIAGLRAWF